MSEKYLSSKLGLNVTLENIKLRWGEIELQNIRCISPLSTKPHFVADSITCSLNPFSILYSKTQIEKLQIRHPILSIELYNPSGKSNNWIEFLMKPQEDKGRLFVVDRVVITDLEFEVTRFDKKLQYLPPIPYFMLNGLGNKSALTIGAVSRELFELCLMQATPRKHLGGLLDTLLEEKQQKDFAGRTFLKGCITQLKSKLETGVDYLQETLFMVD